MQEIDRLIDSGYWIDAALNYSYPGNGGFLGGFTVIVYHKI